MKTEMVAPSQLHRSLERVRGAVVEERKVALNEVLGSKNLAVIRRIPEVLSPLSDEEKEMIARWAEGMTGGEDVSDRDFAFHLMANCGVPGERILMVLERNKTFSRTTLEHIQGVLQGGEVTQKLDEYLYEVAEKLVTEERIPSRDRGRHMLMTLSRTEDQWEQLARRFSNGEISDLRQRVIERFVRDCPDGAGLSLFCDNVVKMCLEIIRAAHKEDVHKEAPHMHWVLTCLERQGKDDEVQRAANLFSERFTTWALPRSVKHRIEDILRPEPPDGMDEILDEPRTVWLAADGNRCESMFSPSGYISSPAIVKSAPVQPAPISTPYSIDDGVRTGWKIRKESGRQVVLVKDGRSVTMYRPKTK